VPPQAKILPVERVLSVDELITASSIKYSVKRQIIASVLMCESNNNPNAIGALGEVGIAQIYLKYHPNISRKQALDPVFSIDYLAHEISHERGSAWSCWRLLYGS
jgi:soluble lytic murein transglycosylase-like protein